MTDDDDDEEDEDEDEEIKAIYESSRMQLDSAALLGVDLTRRGPQSTASKQMECRGYSSLSVCSDHWWVCKIWISGGFLTHSHMYIYIDISPQKLDD